ncbi:unnamed protein product [Urochloa humidicola]
MEAPFIYCPLTGNGSTEDELLKAALEGDLGRLKGVTPFMTAAQSGDLSTVKYLLDHGGRSKVTEFLLSKGIPVDIDYGYGTALHHAANNEQDKTVKILLDHHANV